MSESRNAVKALTETEILDMVRALVTISIWAQCDSQSSQIRQEAMRDIRKKADKALGPYMRKL